MICIIYQLKPIQFENSILHKICVYSLPAAFKSFSNWTTWSGVGGATGKWAPLAWNPFSSATQVTEMVVPSACLYEQDPRATVPASSGVICFWAPDSSTLMPWPVSKLLGTHQRSQVGHSVAYFLSNDQNNEDSYPNLQLPSSFKSLLLLRIGIGGCCWAAHKAIKASRMALNVDNR